MKNLLVYFASGSLGGFANSVTIWLFARFGITKMFGVSLAPAFSPERIYPRMVWGGIWGLAFILPFMKSRLISKGLILSLLPTLYMLFIVFPKHSHQDILGMGLGMLMPVFVVFFNAVWGFFTGLTMKVSK